MTALSPQQRREIQSLLSDRIQYLKSEIEQELSGDAPGHHAHLINEVRDSGDESFADLLDGISDSTLGHHLSELRDHETALANINARLFGQCVDCNEQITFERLKAFPAAKRCIDCKAKLEEQEKMAGRKRPSL